MKKSQLTVFYDGACGVCDGEMRYYRVQAGNKVEFIDIAAPDFDPARYGRTAEEFLSQLHVRDAEGRFHTGVEAFRTLWRALPSPFYPLLAGIVGLPGVHLASRLGYDLFARYRHLLPKSRGGSCPLEPGTHGKQR